MSRKNTIILAIIAGVIIIGCLLYADYNSGFLGIFGKSNKEIGESVIKYINDNGLSQTTATLGSVSEAYGLVKVKIKIGTNEYDSYATKDGKLLFPQVIEMIPADTGKDIGGDTGSKEIKKTDSPMLESFVVSRCPYGLQMQRAIAEAIKNAPSLDQYIKVRYIGSVSGSTITAMHGDAEAKENLRQICIRDEQPTKYWDYVSCQMKASGTEVSCEKSTGVDSAKLAACISDPARGVAFAKKDFDLSAKYGASGSPTMILNGTTASESSYGGRSADGLKSMVCAGFNTQPGLCSTKLDTAQAAVSFSKTYAGTGTTGTGNTGANCDPAQ